MLPGPSSMRTFSTSDVSRLTMSPDRLRSWKLCGSLHSLSNSSCFSSTSTRRDTPTMYRVPALGEPEDALDGRDADQREEDAPKEGGVALSVELAQRVADDQRELDVAERDHRDGERAYAKALAVAEEAPRESGEAVH